MLREFSYVAPKESAELFRVLKTEGKRAKILAGGTDLLIDIREGRFKPVVLIDIKKVPELGKITFSEKEGLSIGAVVTCVELMKNKVTREKYPLLADAAGRIGSPQLRNRATIAGNLCTASPCADMGCSLLAFGAWVEIGSTRGLRRLSLKEFFTGVKKNAMQEDEVLVRIVVPPEMADAQFGMEKLKRIKGHDLAVASVAIIKKGKLLRMGIGSVAPTPVVSRDLPSSISTKDLCSEALKIISPIDDVRASAEYRRFMVQAMVEKIMARMK